jgi:molybdate transport system substrate-binding protein
MTNSWSGLGYRKAVFAALLVAGLARAQEVRVAAASDLQPVLPTLAAKYAAETGVKIENGAPVDMFLSADFVHPQELLANGLTVETQPVPYARGVLVLWARKDSPAQPLTLLALTSDKVTKIAIANPLHAPYGLAATKALESLHATEATKAKLVVAENIGQTAQFAESGNAQVGLISLTIASSPHFKELGSFVRFPAQSYPVIRQCGVVLKGSKNQAAAEAFLAWLTSTAVQADLPKFGLDAAN